jgi:hypothetical protein
VVTVTPFGTRAKFGLGLGLDLDMLLIPVVGQSFVQADTRMSSRETVNPAQRHRQEGLES